MGEIKEDKKQETKSQAPNSRPGNAGKSRIEMKRRPSRKKFDKKRKPKAEFEKSIISIRRVTRVNKGGKRMRLSVCLVIGDKKGRVGIGLAKGSDVRAAEEKAYNYAKKHLVTVPLKNSTIPHEIYFKKGAAKIFMKPAAPGTGVVAGGSLRSVLEMVGVKDVLTKILGTNNAANNAYAAIEALSQMKHKSNKIDSKESKDNKETNNKDIKKA